MRTPRGFGKKYFTLASIQAHTAYVTQHATDNRFACYETFLLLSDDDTADAAPPEDALLLDLPKESDSRKGKRPCFCNLFFKRKARNALRCALFNQAPLCKCRKTKSGIAPPSFPTIQLLLF